MYIVITCREEGKREREGGREGEGEGEREGERGIILYH